VELALVGISAGFSLLGLFGRVFHGGGEDLFGEDDTFSFEDGVELVGGEVF